ncbi:hypothetical protein I4U23_026741 [Adineta vaga]|nr:hypothetical protein I4U23_026741 [Adineta vaga]
MAHLPLGDGPCNCVGMRFALLEAKLGIVKALQVLEFQRCEKTEVPPVLCKMAFLKGKNGLFVRVVRRSQ